MWVVWQENAIELYYIQTQGRAVECIYSRYFTPCLQLWLCIKKLHSVNTIGGQTIVSVGKCLKSKSANQLSDVSNSTFVFQPFGPDYTRISCGGKNHYGLVAVWFGIWGV